VHVVAAGDVADWFAVHVAAFDRLLPLMDSQFRFAPELDAPRLGALASLTGAPGETRA
jgi:hypothetical protein